MASKPLPFLSNPPVPKRRVVSTLLVFLVMLFLLLASPVGVQGASRPIWSLVKSPNPSTTPISNNYLLGVSALSDTDVWAVGFYGPPSGGELQTLALHWDGTKWSKVSTPNVDPDFNLFFGVAAVSKSDVWAVGYAYTPNGLYIHTLIERWNGTQWRIVPSPNSPATNPSYNQLNGVTVSGSTTLWTVGVFDNEVQGNPGERTLTLHTSQG